MKIKAKLFENKKIVFRGTGIESSAYKALQILSVYTTRQKDSSFISIPITADRVEMDLLDGATVKELIYTNSTTRSGWVVSIELDAENDQLKVQLLLVPTDITITVAPSPVLENVKFSSGSAISAARVIPYIDDSTSVVVWGPLQENNGHLIYTVDSTPSGNNDYTIVDHNKIKLNATKWANTIQANVLGLLNVDTY